MNFCKIPENFFPLGKSPLCTLFWEKFWRLENLTFKSPFLKEDPEQFKNIFWIRIVKLSRNFGSFKNTISIDWTFIFIKTVRQDYKDSCILKAFYFIFIKTRSSRKERLFQNY